MRRYLERSISEYNKENGGRVLLLFLLFIIAIYQMVHAGLNGFAIIALSPLLVLLTITTFRYKGIVFWTLFIINYFLMGAQLYVNMPFPTSLPCEMLELLLIAMIVYDYEQFSFKGMGNLMFAAIMLWVLFICLEMFNDTCNLGYHISEWYSEARLICFHILYVYIIFFVFLHDYKKIMKFLYVWAALSIFAGYWAWRQKTFGFNPEEWRWLWAVGMRTHFVNGTIRYFSFFSDAANFGCSIAAASVFFLILGLTAREKWERIFFGIAGVVSMYGMFTSGTRTAIACFLLGGLVYVFLSKSVKIAIPVSIAGLLFYFVMAFTEIGNGNPMIRRMRTAFDRKDASASVRHINQDVMRKYIKDAPWGIGMGAPSIPARNKYNIVSHIPTDSTYVHIWVHTGIIGINVFLISTFLMFAGACYITVFRLKSKVLSGLGAASCCGFAAMQLGGYGNLILFQYPNVILFYGALTIVYILPHIEADYLKLEEEEATKKALAAEEGDTSNTKKTK